MRFVYFDLGQVLMNTENCQGLGGGSGSSSTSNKSTTSNGFNYKTKRNMQYLASAFYLILNKLHEDLPESYGTPIQKKQKVEEKSEDEDEDSNDEETVDGETKSKPKSKSKSKPKSKKKTNKSNKNQKGIEAKRKNPDVFTVTFEDGPLGLDLEAWHNGKGAAIVGIKENTQSSKKRKLFEGQHIVKIGRRKVEHLGFPVVLGMLKKLKRPLKMTLREHPAMSKWVDEHSVRFPAGPLGLDLAKGKYSKRRSSSCNYRWNNFY